MRAYPHIGIQIPQIFLPTKGIDIQKWSVIACDQYTSQPTYWHRVETFVEHSPSTLHLILPEVYLSTLDEADRIQAIRHSMRNYLDRNLLIPFNGMVLVERQTDHKIRHGLMIALDLECYDFHSGSKTLIRASEQTIVERIPPRLRIRQNALLEVPHILVLIDDPDLTVIEPLIEIKTHLEKLYDFELMFQGGHLKGFGVNSGDLEEQVVHALTRLASPDSFASKYGVKQNHAVMLFATGDGNHSLATAKAYWEEIKGSVSSNHPARYALVEIENIHDPGLEFKPIHRLIFGVKENIEPALQAYFGNDLVFNPCMDKETMIQAVDGMQSGDGHTFGIVAEYCYGTATIHHPKANLPVGTLQNFLDDWIKDSGYQDIDFVHGSEVVDEIGRQAGNLGFYLPAMNKKDFFTTVILDGILPRKTFSMGESDEKRFYMECRKIADDRT